MRLFERYSAALFASGCIDFDDLLLLTVRLFHAAPHIAARYAQRFSHILVDEFQDTNSLQYAVVRCLARAHTQLMVVGDPDQSIYSWRHADSVNLVCVAVLCLLLASVAAPSFMFVSLSSLMCAVCCAAPLSARF